MTNELKLLARQAIARRGANPTALSLFRAQSPIHLWIYVAGILAAGAAGTQGHTYFAVGIGSFFASRLIRDLQWFYTLAKQWTLTSELFDWKKIEEFANETTPGKSPVANR